MHVAVVADLTLASSQGAIPDAVAELAEILERHPHTPCSFLLPGAAYGALSADAPGVSQLGRGAEFIRTSLGSPDPTVLPIPVLERIIQRETDGAARLGFAGNVLATKRPWPLHLLPILKRNGIGGLIVPGPDVTGPGVVSYLDAVLPVVGAGTGRETGDELAVWITSIDDVESALESVPPGCATTPGTYFSEHQVVGRADLRSTAVAPTPDLDLLRRKTIRLATRVPERTADEVFDRLADVASTLADPPPAPGRTAAVREAHRNLISARRSIDLARRRGDDWAKVTRLDWDGDGSEDLHIELPETSLVLDLAEGGTVLVLDDKQQLRPLGTLVDGPIGRLLRHQELEGDSVAFGSLVVDVVEEGRDRTRAVFSGQITGGSVECDLVLDGLTLQLRYRLEGVLRGRFGPELALDLADPRMRVDGGEWRNLGNEPAVAEGHRIRIIGEDERSVLFSSRLPVEVFARRAEGGVVVWTHWVTQGSGTYEITIGLDA
jgi:hypothetical protein